MDDRVILKSSTLSLSVHPHEYEKRLHCAALRTFYKTKGEKTRLTFAKKAEVANLLDNGAHANHIQNGFKCSPDTVLNIQASSEKILEEAAKTSITLGCETFRSQKFPEIDRRLYSFVQVT